MPRKPAPVLLSPTEPTVPPSLLIARSMPLQQLLVILLNGAHTTQFTAHAGLMRLIWNAYEHKDADAFLRAVQTYLEQALSHVPQAGRREQIPERIEALRDLIEHAGLPLVGQRVLSVVHALPLS
jgi:hypothetical protein